MCREQHSYECVGRRGLCSWNDGVDLVCELHYVPRFVSTSTWGVSPQMPKLDDMLMNAVVDKSQDYYGEPPVGQLEVSSTYGQYDLCGFPKAAAFWYRVQWLLSIEDGPDKTFPTNHSFEVSERCMRLSLIVAHSTVAHYILTFAFTIVGPSCRVVGVARRIPINIRQQDPRHPRLL